MREVVASWALVTKSLRGHPALTEGPGPSPVGAMGWEMPWLWDTGAKEAPFSGAGRKSSITYVTFPSPFSPSPVPGLSSLAGLLFNVL